MWRKRRQQLKRKVWQWRAVLVATPAVSAVAIAASFAGWFQDLELGMLDRFFRWRPEEASDSRIAIVTVNESDIAHVGEWPMSDAQLAQLIENINEQEPIAIGLDLYRDLPVKQGNQELVKVFESTPNLIGVEKIIGNTVAPPPTLQKDDRVGIADLILDGDGKVRRALLSHKNQAGETRLSLAAKLSLMYLERQGITLEMVDAERMHLRLGKGLFKPFQNNDGGYVGANAGGYQILLNYRGEEDNFLTISMTDVLENRIPPNLMRDRIVLIGATAPSLNDFFLTPYSRQLFDHPQRMAGVAIHANATSQILSAALDERHLIQVLPQPLEWVWIFAWSGTGAILAWSLRSSSVAQTKRFPGRILFTMAISSATAIGIGYLAFLYSWWIPVVLPLVASLGSATVVTDYNSRKVLRDRDKRLTQFLEAVPVGIRVVDARGNTYFLNQKAKEIFGETGTLSAIDRRVYTVDRCYIAGSDCLYPSEKLPAFQALKGEHITADDIEIQNGDKIIPIEAWGTPIYDEEGNVTFAIVAFQDISDRKQAERERQEFIQKLCDLNEELERSLDAEIRLIEAAERFVPNQFLSFLGYESIVEVKVGDAVQKKMSVLFSDIRDFTTLSESMDPDENFKFINAFLSRMEPAILDNNGFIDKYIGDAIMALFGGEADDAVKAGIAMLQDLAEYNTTRGRPGRPQIKIGIGINTGLLMLGTVGGKNRIDGTVISDAVNLSSRVEGLTKQYGVCLLITQDTFLELENPDKYCIRLIDRVVVKGKSEQVTVYEVFDADLPQLRQGKLSTKAEFEKGILLYHLNCFSEAQHLFQQCLDRVPDDRVARIYLQRCQQQENTRPKGTKPKGAA